MPDLKKLTVQGLENLVTNIRRKEMTDHPTHGVTYREALTELARRNGKGANWYELLMPRDGDVVEIGDTGVTATVRWEGARAALIYKGRTTSLTALYKELGAKGHSKLNGAEIDAGMIAKRKELGIG